MDESGVRRAYRGPLTNTDVWDRFALREGDVIVSTPPKSGTTWTQTIVTMLLHGRVGTDRELKDLSPWLDCAFLDADAAVARLEAQGHRRCIKSHTAFDGLPYDPGVVYLGVYRHPVDAHLSMRSHVGRMVPGQRPRLQSRFPRDEREGFAMFVEDPAEDGDLEDMTLEGVVHHFRTALAWAHLPNVHLVHYADLSRDLAGEVARIAGVLGVSHSEGLMAQIVRGAGFETMKSNARADAGGLESDAFKDASQFFASGACGKWESRFSEAEMARFGARLREMLPEAEAVWLERGGTAAWAG